jgi:hypothetical protein
MSLQCQALALNTWYEDIREKGPGRAIKDHTNDLVLEGNT